MKKATITEVTLDEARELYNSHNKTLKELALKCFPENELSENIINMEIETLPISVRQARAWYNTGIEDFEKLALKFFDKEKLECKNYKGITTYYDALYALGLDDTPITMPCCGSFSMDRAASAMFKLMVIQRH